MKRIGLVEMNAEQSYLKLLETLSQRKKAGDLFELAGLAMGGAWIAERLAADLNLPHFGVINVAFHRDDYAEKGMTALRTASTMSTHLPFAPLTSKGRCVDIVLAVRSAVMPFSA